MNKLDIFISILLFLLTIGIITLLILLLVNKPDKLPENKVDDDISLSNLFSFNFIDIDSTPVYTEQNTNLGLTGRLILNCFIGICPTIDFTYDYEGNVEYHYRGKIDYSCSEQCSYNGKDECVCDDADKNIGSCSRKYDDQYEIGKYCVADNAIYNWKGKRFTVVKKEIFTYYKNVILKEEECPEGTIDCGIIDDNENRLCAPSNFNCPINYLSEKKINNNKLHSSVVIGNKTFYYTFDGDTATKRKIIGGLVADTDLYLNEDNDEKVIIDTDTISGFLSWNKNLYKQVDLGFDPYQEENIDQKGNGYLRIFYNKKINLSEFRENFETYKLNHEINEDVIKPIRKKNKYIGIFGIISFGFLSVLIIIYWLDGGFFDLKSILSACFCIFLIFYILTFIFVCIIFHKFNKLKRLDSSVDKFPRILNLILFILLLVIFVYFIFILIYFSYLRRKCEYCSCNICNKKSQKNNTVSNITVQAKSTIENDKTNQGDQISTLNINN